VRKSEIFPRQIKVHNYRSKNRDTQSETVMCWTNGIFKMCLVSLYQVLNLSASSTTITGRHDLAEILLKVALNTTNLLNLFLIWDNLGTQIYNRFKITSAPIMIQPVFCSYILKARFLFIRREYQINSSYLIIKNLLFSLQILPDFHVEYFRVNFFFILYVNLKDSPSP
jgi:hypothetical protein